MIRICIFVIHQNLIIMKPILAISDRRARQLLVNLCLSRGFTTFAETVRELPESCVQSLLAEMLDELSSQVVLKSSSHETDRA